MCASYVCFLHFNMSCHKPVFTMTGCHDATCQAVFLDKPALQAAMQLQQVLVIGVQADTLIWSITLSMEYFTYVPIVEVYPAPLMASLLVLLSSFCTAADAEELEHLRQLWEGIQHPCRSAAYTGTPRRGSRNST